MIQLLVFMALFLLFACLCSWLANRWLRRLVAAVLALLCCVQLGAWYLTGGWLDDRTLKHLNWSDINQFAFQFKTEMGLFVLSWLLLTGLMLLIAHILRSRTQQWLTVLLAGLSVIGMAYPPGMIQPLWHSAQLAQASSESIESGLQQLGIKPNAYILPHQVTATAGKNLLVISLESIEQGFLQTPLAELTPNLTRLSQQWTYFDQVPPLKGSDWTAGSMYTLLTGLPALFNQSHFNNNHVFQGSQQFGLTSLVTVLQAAGYQHQYLIGKPEFAGMDQMLNTLGIPVVSERNTLGRYPKAEPGLHDQDLFAEARLQIQALRQQDRPFALFMSTINTHFPNGILDPRLIGVVPEQDNPLAFNVAATDHLLGAFIDYLEASGVLDDTVVFIFPDHTLMGNTGPIIEALQQQPRQLYVISSAPSERFTNPDKQPLFQTHLPRLILQGAEVISNAQFLSDFIPAGTMADFVNQQQLPIAALNNTALNRIDYQSGFELSLENRRIVLHSPQHQLSMTERGLQHTEVYQVLFNDQWVPLEQGLISLNEAHVNDHIDPMQEHRYLLVQVDRGRIKQVTLTDRMGTEIQLSQAPFAFQPEQLASLNLQAKQRLQQWQSQQLERRVPLPEFAADPQRFIAHAGGLIDGHKYTNSLEALNHSYAVGFRLFELDIQSTADGHFVAVHDWPQWQQQTAFVGDLPPNLAEFKQHPIWQQYTPLDMSAINRWFAEHPEAILVTDKTNDPEQFIPQFIDRNRLMMELFSWSAVETAQQLNLKAAIPTGDLMFNYPGNPVSRLQQMGIEYLAASRRWVDTAPGLLRQLNDAGIRIFAFHIGFDPGKDESHLVCQERHHFYGLYADAWQFNDWPNCAQ